MDRRPEEQSTARRIVIAVDHPSLDGAFGRFVAELWTDVFDHEHPPTPWTPTAELIDRLLAPRTMRLGVMSQGRLLAVAAVDNDGGLALAVIAEPDRQVLADELGRAVERRAAVLGYPALHPYTTTTRLAG
jgi:hypothetical protein